MTLATLTISATIPARTAELSDSWLMEFMGRTGHASDGGLEVSHLSVLLTETVQGLALREGGLYVDGTAGEGGSGHSLKLDAAIGSRRRAAPACWRALRPWR